MVLEELGVPYEVEEFPDFSQLHTPVYEKYNPNGRVPVILDPNNNDFVLWESGAILHYLVEKYDSTHNLHSDKLNEKYLEEQYLHFQMPGQGPYFGQAAWFSWFSPETIPSARDRYIKEIRRVTAVLDAILNGKEYLLGENVSYVDFSFIPWYWLAPKLDPDLEAIIQKQHP